MILYGLLDHFQVISGRDKISFALSNAIVFWLSDVDVNLVWIVYQIVLVELNFATLLIVVGYNNFRLRRRTSILEMVNVLQVTYQIGPCLFAQDATVL